MGTNFYMKRIPTEDDIQMMSTLALERKLDELQTFVNELNKEIHIGKRSCGWKFLFNHQDGKYFDPKSQESLKAWLSDPHYQIEDEYGGKLTFEEFWDMVREWDANPNNNWDDSAYYKYERSRGNGQFEHPCCPSVAYEIYNMFGVRPLYHDFWLDGLRYSTSTEFC